MTSTKPSVSGPQTVLAHESAEQFDQMLNKYMAGLQPQTEHERFAVRQMAGFRWKLDRLSRIEAAAFEELISPSHPSSPDRTIAAALLGKGDLLSRLQRHRESLERSYYRAHKEFQASRIARLADPDAELCRALDAYINAPVPLTRDVIVRTKTNSPAASTSDLPTFGPSVTGPIGDPFSPV